ncbi:MAG: hypothetical protein CMB80_02590 [Flammeovirgaceae bacterium]|nr:hypothetical protein [Flammeovirgaceae bacterium]
MAATKWNQDIQTFKKGFDGGTRPNRFVVTGEIGGSSTQAVESLYVKAASIPAQTLGIIQVPFRGRVAKLPGDRSYPEWTFTMLDSNAGGDSTGEAVNWRRKFEIWHEAFNKHFENVAEDATVLDGTDENYYTNWRVTQLDTQGNELSERTILLANCWPTEVGTIDLSYDTADTLTEYSVTLAYDYITLASGTGTSESVMIGDQERFGDDKDNG